MRVYGLLNEWYGQLRGYNRRRIRREAAANASLFHEALAALTADLYRQRVLAAFDVFPAYAAKVGMDRAELERLELPAESYRLPIWTRADQVALWDAGADSPVPGAFAHSTGGSTGVPVRFHVTRESYEWRTAVSDRGYGWAGAEEGRKAFFVWGAAIDKAARLQRWKEDLHHAVQRRRFFNSFQFDAERKNACCAAIERYRPAAVIGYAGNLVDLALYVRDNPDKLRWRAESVLTAAEGLHPGQRELLESTLGAAVFETYGSREFMLIGMECSAHAGYHISSDNLVVEAVRDDGSPAKPGESGRILVTDLHNMATPFIRYEIGDIGALTNEPCSCGLPFPRLLRVDGRIQEAITKKDGSTLTALFIPHLMKEFTWVDGYQIAQQEPGEIDVRLLASRDPTREDTAPIEQKLKEQLGSDMRITFRRVSSLQKSRSGKTPIVVQN